MNYTGRAQGRREAPIGERLIALRKRAALSITDLSGKANVSVGMISQIERGLTNPSLRTLTRLSDALQVPLMTLLELETPATADAMQGDIVRTLTSRPFFKVGDDGVIKELLSPSGDHLLQMMVISLPPGSNSGEALIGKGEKAGWVMEGTGLLTLGSSVVQLEAGDSFQFSSEIPHSIGNVGQQHAKIFWIMAVEKTNVTI